MQLRCIFWDLQFISVLWIFINFKLSLIIEKCNLIYYTFTISIVNKCNKRMEMKFLSEELYLLSILKLCSLVVQKPFNNVNGGWYFGPINPACYAFKKDVFFFVCMCM